MGNRLRWMMRFEKHNLCEATRIKKNSPYIDDDDYDWYQSEEW